ncbi:MAG: carbohydrate ABC transporter permease, partial [Termitinemataceae bacterium]
MNVQVQHRSSLHKQLAYAKVAERILEFIMFLICFITLYPIWYTLVLSFNESADTMLGGIYWWPRKFTLESYRAVF